MSIRLSVNELSESALRQACAEADPYLVLGSATELNAIDKGPLVLEIGFPCNRYHALQPMPLMGFAGPATLAQRVVNASEARPASASISTKVPIGTVKIRSWWPIIAPE